MTKPIVVLISSDLPQQGKDTFASFLCAISPDEYEPMHGSFAEALKFFVCDKYNLNYDSMMNNSVYKEQHRDKLIFEGNDARMQDAFVWCKKLVQYRIRTFLLECDGKIPLIVISDCRYHNESDYFRKKELCGFDAFVYSVHIVVNDSIMEQRFGRDKYYKLCAAGRTNSQRELNFKYGTEFDSIISNSGSMEEFKTKIRTEWDIIEKRYKNKC